MDRLSRMLAAAQGMGGGGGGQAQVRTNDNTCTPANSPSPSLAPVIFCDVMDARCEQSASWDMDFGWIGE